MIWPLHSLVLQLTWLSLTWATCRCGTSFSQSSNVCRSACAWLYEQYFHFVNIDTLNPKMAGAEKTKRTRCRMSRRAIWSLSITTCQSAWSTFSLSTKRLWLIATPRLSTGNFSFACVLLEYIPESEHPTDALIHNIRCPSPLFHVSLYCMMHFIRLASRFRLCLDINGEALARI